MNTLNILYSEKEWASLPGPYILFYGKGNGFRKFYDVLQLLILNETEELILNNLNFVKVEGTDKQIVFRSERHGNILCRIESDRIVSILDGWYYSIMSYAAIRLLNHDSAATYEFDEFEGHNLIEECIFVFKV